jgi:hypothetical protein
VTDVTSAALAISGVRFRFQAAALNSADWFRTAVLERSCKVIRCQEAQCLAQGLGSGAAEGSLETPLGVRPEGVGFRELLATLARKSYQPITPIVRVDCHSNATIALQRL